ncbi:MAG: dimethylamine monooxygenase subunit DmmA family protein [Acidihalobacter sp.]|uniref:dimethylamine monooxygenase subunit DmmA family protein n=1 Tax=Acidihalobacter sp. TaxID=1872108 RepID=UPI00307FA3E0
MSAVPASVPGMTSTDTQDISQLAGVKSRPVHAPLRADPVARNHLLVAEAPGLEAVTRVLDALDGRGVPTEVLWLGVAPQALAGRAALSAFDDMAALAEALRERLATSGMGTRLYLAGREAFVWEAGLPARAAGLREDEIQREACGSRARRVFCVHCRHLLEAVTVNPVVCPNCGVVLEVRDHFSRALAAYLGVCANAESPCELPETQETFA